MGYTYCFLLLFARIILGQNLQVQTVWYPTLILKSDFEIAKAEVTLQSELQCSMVANVNEANLFCFVDQQCKMSIQIKPKISTMTESPENYYQCYTNSKNFKFSYQINENLLFCR